MKVYLRGSSDFQKVYRHGKRYEGVLMTAFVLPNNLSHNRLGVTASRKALGNAVQRNRAKRLLKETFRLKTSSLESLPQTYDWVINAKRRIASLKVAAAIEEFELLLNRVAKAESKEEESKSPGVGNT
jgi:ribonuclease P protein component